LLCVRGRLVAILGLTAAGAVLAALSLEGAMPALASLLVGLALVTLSSDPAVEGFRGLSERTGMSEHMAGIVSSMASNLPEAVLAVFMALSPHLREVAVLTVMLASAFNGLLLGALVIMLTYRGGRVRVPREALEHDVEVMRVTIAFSALILGAGLILNVFHGRPSLPREISAFMLASYAGYLYFVSKAAGERGRSRGSEGGGWALSLALGLAGILVSAELISSAAEFMVRELGLHVVVAATVIAFAGSVPEHFLALVSAKRGHVELGVSNLVSGVVQSVMVILPLLSAVAPLYLDGYVLYQFLAVASTLWVTKKAIVDDSALTLDEGVYIMMAHLLGIVLFDELSWLM